MNTVLQFRSKDGKLVATYNYCNASTYVDKATYEITLDGDTINPYCNTSVSEDVFRKRMTDLIGKYDKLMDELTEPYSKWSLQ